MINIYTERLPTELTVNFEDGRLVYGTKSKHLKTRSRPLQLFQRNLNRRRTWPYPQRYGAAKIYGGLPGV